MGTSNNYFFFFSLFYLDDASIDADADAYATGR